MTLKPWHREALQKYWERGGSAEALVQNAENLPDGLTKSLAEGILNGALDEVPAHILEWVLARAKAEKTKPERVPLANDMVETLIAERERTGVGQTALLKQADSVPMGLSPGLISAWINGNAETARKDYLNWVLARWRELPDG